MNLVKRRRLNADFLAPSVRTAGTSKDPSFSPFPTSAPSAGRRLPADRAATRPTAQLAGWETKPRRLIRSEDITLIQPRLGGTNLLFAPALH